MRSCGTLRFAAAVVLAVLHAITASAASSTWLDLVAPVMTSSERKLYLSLSPDERAKFEENFWSGKAVTGEEYFKRIQYVDSAFGSSKPASGANTDPGRVYLALGPPTKVTRIPSSRIFVPLEIWYYDVVPGVLNTELRLIFYQKNSVGLPKLYSPTADTIRALLIPQAATRSMFGPNDQISESDIRKILKVPPSEDEVVTAAVNVATGIKYTGNDEILGQITSPEAILRKPPQTRVSSRFIVARPKLDMLVTPSVYGGSQVDLRLETSAQRQVDVEILQDAVTVYQNHLRLKFSKAESIEYTHRLDLLPGAYQVMFTVDGKAFAYPLLVKEHAAMSEILRTDPGTDVERRQTPFEFDGKQLHLNANGRIAAVAMASPGKVTWRLRRGAEVFWRSISDGQQFATVELPSKGLAPGAYQLEAVTENDSRTAEFVVARETRESPDATAISFNANLAPPNRYAFIGHQWLLRGKIEEARKSLDASLSKGATPESSVELARVDVLAGRLDEARERVRQVLAARPDDFQALSVLAYIEAKFQDYPVAAELYRRALAVQDSPALRVALAKLPKE
jgi:GWxTD domain-containing protein